MPDGKQTVRAVLILIILSGENEKFYALPEEKQSQILNAAYKVFATNQYKKAPTSEIAAEAGISGNDKSLGNSLWKRDGK